MTPPAREEHTLMDAEVREKIHLEIFKRTGAYLANDHILLPSGQHTTEYIEKTLVTTEASFTEGLGAVIAKHFAPWPIDVGAVDRSWRPDPLALCRPGSSVAADPHVRHQGVSPATPGGACPWNFNDCIRPPPRS